MLLKQIFFSLSWSYSLVFSAENSLLKFTELKFTDRRLETLLYQKDCAISPVHQLLLTGLSFVQLETPIGIFTIYQLQDPNTAAHYVRPTHDRLPIEYVEAVEQQLRESNLLVGALCFPTQHAIEKTEIISLK